MPARRSTDSQRKSIEMSIGTYAPGLTADSKIGVLADDPDPNSTIARPALVKAAISFAAAERIERSVRVG